MQLNSLNLNSFYVFQRVFTLKSMTLAARELAMTQPGVSQHISSLEQDLDLQLFIRDRKTIIPTKAAVALYNSTVNLTRSLQSTLSEITEDQGFLASEVTIGAPIEFGNNILMPILAQLNRDHPEVKFHLRYGLSKEMNQLIANGEVDFAFVDDFQISKGVNYEQVYQEELVLICSQKYLNNRKDDDKKFYENLHYVSYFEDKMILNEWFKTAMGYKKIDLQTIMRTEDAQGVAAFIKQDMGVGVLPKHMLKSVDTVKDYYVFQPKYKSVYNGISLSYLERRIEGPFLNFIYSYFISKFT